LEPRRRPTAKFQNGFALYHAVAMKLKHPLKAALIDECGKAQTVDFGAEKLCIGLSVSPDCGIRVQFLPHWQMFWDEQIMIWATAPFIYEYDIFNLR